MCPAPSPVCALYLKRRSGAKVGINAHTGSSARPSRLTATHSCVQTHAEIEQQLCKIKSVLFNFMHGINYKAAFCVCTYNGCVDIAILCVVL